MTLFQLSILALTAVILGRLRRGRELSLLAASSFVIFWLQPAQPFPSLAFWLPAVTLALTAICWILTAAPEARGWKQNWPAASILVGVILLVDLNRYFGLEQILMTTAPRLPLVVFVLAASLGIVLLAGRLSRLQRFLLFSLAICLIIIFIFLKSPALMSRIFEKVNGFTDGENATNANGLAWLGFSYVSFRLLHTIRDRQMGRLPPLNFGEYVSFVIFFPSFIAGPIDRAERFAQDLRSPLSLANQDWIEAGRRFFLGLFKKFVLADTLAVIALNDTLVGQVQSPGWMWIFLYAYALRIYFDFSGYTDIAIGLARPLGIRLPENFSSPYLKPNLTQFWNSWHMTLTQWFRAYYFNLLTRTLRTAKSPWPAPLIILVTQASSMLMIGLWHGVTWGFVVWGLWHGVGLFIQNRWSEFVRGRSTGRTQGAAGKAFLNATGVFLTFHFVSLGWLFFTLSTPTLAWQAFVKLFGLN